MVEMVKRKKSRALFPRFSYGAKITLTILITSSLQHVNLLHRN